MLKSPKPIRADQTCFTEEQRFLDPASIKALLRARAVRPLPAPQVQGRRQGGVRPGGARA